MLEYTTAETATANTAFAIHKNNTSKRGKSRKADAITWHKRMGHPGPQALEHLVQQSQGVRIKGIPTVKCNACGKAKLKRQIRRQPRELTEGPGERVAIDFHDYEADSLTGEKSQMLITN